MQIDGGVGGGQRRHGECTHRVAGGGGENHRCRIHYKLLRLRHDGGGCVVLGG